MVAFASVALATDLHLQIMKRINVDSRAVTGAAYECHANCGMFLFGILFPIPHTH